MNATSGLQELVEAIDEFQDSYPPGDWEALDRERAHRLLTYLRERLAGPRIVVEEHRMPERALRETIKPRFVWPLATGR